MNLGAMAQLKKCSTFFRPPNHQPHPVAPPHKADRSTTSTVTPFLLRCIVGQDGMRPRKNEAEAAQQVGQAPRPVVSHAFSARI
jgi:hypothetical protein